MCSGPKWIDKLKKESSSVQRANYSVMHHKGTFNMAYNIDADTNVDANNRNEFNFSANVSVNIENVVDVEAMFWMFNAQLSVSVTPLQVT